MNKNGNLVNEIKSLLVDINLKTYIYGILVIVVLIFLIILNKNTNSYGYSVKDDNKTACYDADGKEISASGKYCLNILNTAKDFGINLNQMDEATDYTNDSKNNLTIDMSQDLVLTNLYLKQNGITDGVQRGEILANVIKNYQNSAQGKIYTKKDLNLNRREDNASLIEYKSELYNTFSKYNTDLKSNSSYTIESYININNNFIESLLSIAATEAGSEYQIETINLISNFNAYLNALSQVYIDPVKYLALDGENYLTNFSKKITIINNNIKSYFDNLNIN